VTSANGTGQSPGQLASEVAKDLSTLVRQEIALAKAELQQEAKTAGVAAGAFGGAGFAGSPRCGASAPSCRSAGRR
jgi:hypothetical protein